jgi:hypothetical protein
MTGGLHSQEEIQNGRGSSQWIVRYTLNQGRRAMADNEATTPKIAEDIADRLKAEEERREEDRWA